VLIAASLATEPSWELPGKGHGLLTKALLDAFGASTAPQEIAVLMSDVMQRVRTEAARIGKSQTPVLLGYVEGGLRFPPLRPGPLFHAAFPERRLKVVGANLGDLVLVGIPQLVVERWAAQFAGGLNALQQNAVNEFGVLVDKSLLVVAPTGAGKTFVGEMAAMKAISEGKRTVFLLPYRALVNEKYQDFAASYGEMLGLRVIRCTGDYFDQTSAFIRGKYDLAILTYEMFLRLSLDTSSVQEQLGLVVLDEAQFIADPHRGIVVELLLTNLLSARDRDIRPQIVALSAVIGELNHFDDWLGLSVLESKVRPVPLIEGVLDRGGTFQYMSEAGEQKQSQLLPVGAVTQRKEDPSAQDVIVPLVRMLVHERDETVLVFRNQRGPAEGCARYLAKELGLAPATNALRKLPTLDLSASSQALRESLQGGTAFHTANLTREERDIIERSFRAAGGELRVIAATTTLAAGINTPASTVVLAEQEFIGEDGRPFTIAEYKNMAGRAGRPGFGKPGRAIILADTSLQREMLFTKYVLGLPEALRSSFETDQLDTWILRLLAQVPRVPKTQVLKLLANTFGGYLANREDLSWLQRTQGTLEHLLERMGRLQLTEIIGEDLQLTLLGRACGRSFLAFESCLRLVELLQNAPKPLSAVTLMVLLQGLPEADQTYTPLMPRANTDKARPQQLNVRIGRDVVLALQRGVSSPEEFARRCKRALVLLDWIAGAAVSQIESSYSPTPYAGRTTLGDVRRFADMTRFHLGSTADIIAAMLLGTPALDEEIEALLKRLELGVPGELLSLATSSAGLTRGEVLSLRDAGVTTLARVIEHADRLDTILGSHRASLLLRAAQQGN
jgi:helicase